MKTVAIVSVAVLLGFGITFWVLYLSNRSKEASGGGDKHKKSPPPDHEGDHSHDDHGHGHSKPSAWKSVFRFLYFIILVIVAYSLGMTYLNRPPQREKEEEVTRRFGYAFDGKKSDPVNVTITPNYLEFYVFPPGRQKVRVRWFRYGEGYWETRIDGKTVSGEFKVVNKTNYPEKDFEEWTKKEGVKALSFDSEDAAAAPKTVELFP